MSITGEPFSFYSISIWFYGDVHAATNVTESAKCVHSMHYAYTFQRDSHLTSPLLFAGILKSHRRHCTLYTLAHIPIFISRIREKSRKKNRIPQKACTDTSKMDRNAKGNCSMGCIIHKIKYDTKRRVTKILGAYLGVVICRRNGGVSSTCLWSNNP